MEAWRDVVGYEGIYKVSDRGNVKTAEGKVTWSNRWNTWRKWDVRVLKQKTDKRGYKRVSLWKGGKETTRLVHQLVAEAFLSNPESQPIINHKDGDPGNNRADNLEWCDYRHNVIHAFENGMNRSPKPVKIIRKEDGESKVFLSLADASRWAGRNPGYFSGFMVRGKNETKEYVMEKITFEEYRSHVEQDKRVSKE